MKKKWILLFLIPVMFLTGCEEEIKVEIIPDTESPVISLIGEEDIYLDIDDEFIDPGVTVTDNEDLDTTLIISGQDFETSLTNVYTIYYNAFDDSGNVAQEVVRRVHVTFREPGVLTSFTYESYDFIGVLIMTFDHDDVLVDLYANLYDGETLISSVEITEQTQSIQFAGLESGIHYQLLVEGTYDLGCGHTTTTFSDGPINVGVYRRIGEDIRIEIDNDVKFYALQKMIYLPYDQSNYSKSKRMILTLSSIDEELLVMLANTNEKIILTDGVITDVYEYFHLRGVPIGGDPNNDTIDDRPGICCSPTVVKIGYSGTSINLMLQISGTLFSSLIFGDVLTEDFFNIYTSEATQMFPESRYQNEPYEFFIECFAYYYYSELSKQELLDNAPLTYQYINDLITEIIETYIEE